MTHLRPTLFATLIALTSQSFAVENDPLEVTVTAKRFNYPINKTAANTAVITREELERRNITTLSEALDILPGVFIARNGGLASTSSVFIRGAESNHTVILLNGTRLTSTVDGRPPIEQIPFNDIDRIELVKGGLSALYGADAIGGVIQIFTSQRKSETSIQVSLGSDSTKTSNVRISDQWSEDGGYSMSIGASDSDGYSASSDKLLDNDRDGYEALNLSFNAFQRVNDWKLGASLGSWEGETEYDSRPNTFNPTPDNKSLYETDRISFYADYSGESADYKTSVSRTLNHFLPFYDGSAINQSNATDAERNELSTQTVQYLTPSITLVAGLDYRNENITSYGRETSTNSRGLFGAVNLDRPTYAADLSARRESDSEFGYHTTWGIGYSYFLPNNSVLFASARTGFSTPTYLDSYSTELLPEESLNHEVGVRSLLGESKTELQLSLFKNRYDNLLTYNFASFETENLGKSEAQGIELLITRAFDLGTLSVGHTYTDTENRTNDGKQLVNRPRNLTQISFSHQFMDDSSAVIDIQRVADYLSFPDVDMPTYTIVNLGWSKDVFKTASIGVRVSNLFDEEYESLSGYNGRGRYVEASLSYTF